MKLTYARCTSLFPGEESKVVKCPICKEQLDTQFLEDDEEWVWRNAITVMGKVCASHGSHAIINKVQPQLATKAYHATRHADALSSQTAARLHDQPNRGSTPYHGLVLDLVLPKQVRV